MRGWRTEWDSNPRWASTHGGFQDRCLQPLGHLSIAGADWGIRGGRIVCSLSGGGRIARFLQIVKNGRLGAVAAAGLGGGSV